MRKHAQISYHPVPHNPQRSHAHWRLHCRPSSPLPCYEVLLRLAAPPACLSRLRCLLTFESWEISNRSDLDKALRLIGRTITILQSLGPQVQYRKTQIMLSLQSRLARKWLSSYTTERKHGTHLNIPGPNEVPVVTEIKYLGVVLSYGDFEMATLKYRIGCAASVDQNE